MKINKIIYILFAVILINTNIKVVKAYDSNSCNNESNACAVCTYGINNYFKIEFLVKSDGKNVSFTENYSKDSSQAPLMYTVISINNNDFINNDKIECPSNIYYNSTELADNSRAVFSFNKGDVKLSLNKKSYNNNKNISSSTVNTNTNSSTNINSNSNSSTTTSTNNNSNINSNTSSNKTNTGVNPGTPVSGCEILGSEFYDYLRAIFFWIQIFGPILALVLSMVDIVKAVASADEDMKKKTIKALPKRIIAAILLILIPFVIQVLFSLVDDINGTICVL